MHCQVPRNATSTYVPEDFIKSFVRLFEAEVSAKGRGDGTELGQNGIMPGIVNSSYKYSQRVFAK